MKKAALHIFSIGLAFTVLFSTFSFTVHKHYCGKSLVGQAVFSSAKLCKSEMDSCSVEGSMVMEDDKDHCCSNKKDKIKGQDELNISIHSFDHISPHFLIPLAFQFPELINEVSLKTIPNPAYKPPLLVANIQIMDQVFLI